MVGRTRLVHANRSLPWAVDLQALLAKTVGVPALLGEVLAAVDGIDEVWIFGSWAERYIGHAGPPPADVDVAVRSDEHKYELQSLMRTSYAVFSLKTQKAKQST